MKKVNIPAQIRIDNKKLKLWESGPKYLIDKKKEELQEYNRKQTARGGKRSGYDKYKFRVVKYGDTYAIYTD